MGVGLATSRTSARLTRLLSATALGCLLAAGAVGSLAFAQALDSLGEGTPSGSQMLLEADTLVYDQDANTVTAEGAVRIEYGGNRIVAQRVTYNRETSRVTASGDVQLIDRDGTKIFTDEIDITDDFSDGFVNALRVETTDKTYFAAESATREQGRLTTFNNGVYTACEPCEEKPNRPPIWRVKARKIIWNGEEKTVRFERARFELFGLPIAFIPVFEIPDPTVKRKSGFLFPSINYKDGLGVGVSVPYYLALSPTYDLTLMPTYWSKQGFLAQAEWRQRFNSGEYSIRVAGIRQNEPEAFSEGRINRGREDDLNELRGMAGTKGDFEINPRWRFGWDLLFQSDKNFSKTYSIFGYNETIRQSEVRLEGLNDRNFFDLRALHFRIQEDVFDESRRSLDDEQPFVLPTFDYSFTPDQPLAGGELNIDVNARVLRRDEVDDTERRILNDDDDDTEDEFEDVFERVPGIGGESGRITAEAEWKRSYITDAGLMLTPLLQFQADSTFVDATDESIAAIEAMADNPQIDAGTDIQSAYNRYMATAGMEVRWPVLFSTTSSSHVLEPMAQVFARPDEGDRTDLGIPNEDAQAFVFDASTLFERDKFSGYDRIEGGSRANIGLRYSGVFGGWTSNALFGQSYHLGGLNSFDSPDLVNAGAFSGLETETSDYVGMVGFVSPWGLAASLSGRFDEQTFEARRAEVKASYSLDPITISARYAFIQAQPLYGFDEDRRAASLGASARFAENWRVFGSGTYNFETSTLVKNSVGFSYDDECFTYAMTFSQTRSSDRTAETEQTVGFKVAFRTIGDFGTSTGALETFE